MWNWVHGWVGYLFLSVLPCRLPLDVLFVQFLLLKFLVDCFCSGHSTTHFFKFLVPIYVLLASASLSYIYLNALCSLTTALNSLSHCICYVFNCGVFIALRPLMMQLYTQDWCISAETCAGTHYLINGTKFFS